MEAVDVRILMRDIAKFLKAMSDGEIPFTTTPEMNYDGPDRRRHKAPMSEATPRKATAPEKRAAADRKARSTGGGKHNGTSGDSHKPRSVKGHPQPARVEYEMTVPQDGQKLDTSGLPPAAMSILKYLALTGRASIASLAEEAKLKRSTVQNSLTLLRKRQLVEPTRVGGEEEESPEGPTV